MKLRAPSCREFHLATLTRSLAKASCHHKKRVLLRATSSDRFRRQRCEDMILLCISSYRHRPGEFLCHAAGLPEQRLCDTLCIGAASAEVVAGSGSWGQSMAVHGDRIYILEQATTQMKITQKTETRYAEVPFDIGGSARHGARVGDFTLGSLMKMWTREDLDIHGQRRERW